MAGASWPGLLDFGHLVVGAIVERRSGSVHIRIVSPCPLCRPSVLRNPSYSLFVGFLHLPTNRPALRRPEVTSFVASLDRQESAEQNWFGLGSCVEAISTDRRALRLTPSCRLESPVDGERSDTRSTNTNENTQGRTQVPTLVRTTSAAGTGARSAGASACSRAWQSAWPCLQHPAPAGGGQGRGSWLGARRAGGRMAQSCMLFRPLEVEVMAWGFRVTCSDCLHKWEGISMSLWFGPHVVLEADEMQSLFCPRCYQRLCFPRTLERRTWQRWREHFLLREEAKSSFLRSQSGHACPPGQRPRLPPGACKRPQNGVVARKATQNSACPSPTQIRGLVGHFYQGLRPNSGQTLGAGQSRSPRSRARWGWGSFRLLLPSRADVDTIRSTTAVQFSPRGLGSARSACGGSARSAGTLPSFAIIGISPQPP